MSIYASRSLRRTPTGGFLDGGPDAPPPGLRPRRVQRLKERRRRRRLWIVLVVVVALLGAAAAVVLKDGPAKRSVPGPVGGGPPPSSLVWAVTTTDPATGQQLAAVALIAVPPGGAPVAVAVPDTMLVDLPGGAGPQVGIAGTTGASAMEAVQAALNRRVGHYVESTPQEIGALVSRLGGASVTVEAAFPFGAGTLGPGPLTMTGPQVSAYLAASTVEDRTARWEDVLAGLLDVKGRPGAWHGFLGDTDDAGIVASLLVAANGAPVIELPTTPTADGGLQADPQQLSKLIQARLGSSVGPLTRVIVQNGTGVPGQGAAIGALLAPAGFRVVASQNAASFNETETKVVASSGRFVGRAQEVQRLLGAGNVYVGSQPTGIADITIIVGKDFTGA